MFNVQALSQMIKLMVARGQALKVSKKAVGEILAVVGHDFLHLDRTSLMQGVQKQASGRGCLLALHLKEYSAHGTVNGQPYLGSQEHFRYPVLRA